VCQRKDSALNILMRCIKESNSSYQDWQNCVKIANDAPLNKKECCIMLIKSGVCNEGIFYHETVGTVVRNYIKSKLQFGLYMNELSVLISKQLNCFCE